MRGRRRREGENGERGCEDGRQGRTLTGHDELPFGCGSASGRSECRTSSGRPPQTGVELPDGPDADPIVVFVRRPLFAGRWPLSIVRWPPLPADRSASAANRIKSGSASAPIRLRFGSSSAAPRLQLGSGSAEQRQTPEPRRRQVLRPALQTTRTVFQFIDRGDAGLDRRDNIELLVVGYDTLAAVVLQTLLRTYLANRE